MVNGGFELLPGGCELGEELAADVSHFVVLSGRSGGGFLPLVGEETVVFEAGEQRVECTFDHNEVRLL